MPEQIISASGVQYGLIINPDGSIPVSGEFGAGAGGGSESVITAGSVEVYQNTASDLLVDIGNIGSVAITTDPLPISGTMTPGGLSSFQIIRKDSGSPAIDYVFSQVSETILIDNLGSSSIYFTFDAICCCVSLPRSRLIQRKNL